MSESFVLGLNQYGHSAAACLVDGAGRVVHALAKERVTRRKHDGGDVAAVVETLLERAGLGLDRIERAVTNCHLFRVRPFECDLPWAVAQHHFPPSCLADANLLPGVETHELSHHLAHAWSVLGDLPERGGLILVADGIGSPWADVHRRSVGAELGPYTSDADLPAAAGFREVPDGRGGELPGTGTWREAETVYRADGLRLERVFKRWTRERAPVLLHNYGFEHMESLGAVYSRVSSHVFGDWNVCGKVMGLAPWAARWAEGRAPRPVLRGPLEELRVDWDRLRAEPAPNAWDADGDPEARAAHARLAADVQRDLEEVLLEFLTRLRRATGARSLALVGGVALNSTANGRIAREAGFEHVVVPPWPGDDGVALGCALFGRRGLDRGGARRSGAELRATSVANAPAPAGPAVDRAPTVPYLGTSATDRDLAEALADVSPWVEARVCDDAGLAPDPAAMDAAWLASARGRVELAADALARGETVGWFQGRSEFGPRALGHRSILATPADAGMVARINAAIKKRELFRPFAPAVLAERAEELFEDVGPSPWMSLTVRARPAAVERIPAVVHVDGTARVQTLTAAAEPLFRALVEAFAERTGLPLVLNTSMNLRGEPLAEAPADALRLLLEGDLDLLVLEDRAVRRRAFPGEAALAAAVPTADPRWRAEVVSDAGGDAVAVTLAGPGGTWDSDALELALLEACDGETAAGKLLAELAAELEAGEDDLRDALRTLHRRRLVSFAR